VNRFAAIALLLLVSCCHKETKTDSSVTSDVVKTDGTVTDKTREGSVDKTHTEGPSVTTRVEDDVYLIADGRAVMEAWLAAHGSSTPDAGDRAATSTPADRAVSPPVLVRRHIETRTERGPVVDTTKKDDKAATEVKTKIAEQAKTKADASADVVKDSALPGWKLYGAMIVALLLALLAGLAVLKFKLWKP
jgi:hypothetical protein